MSLPKQQALFTSEEIALLERCLAEEDYPDLPTELQLSRMAEHLQGKLKTGRSTVDMAVYLRLRLERRSNDTNGQTSKVEGVSVPNAPLFKQFGELRAKEEESQRSKHYVCRSKRKVRPTELVRERRSLQDFAHGQDANTNDCRVIFERKSRKNLQGKDQSGILQQSNQWIFNEHFYCSYDRNYFKEDKPMKKILDELNFIEKLSYYQQRLLRRALPKPNLFGPQFIYLQLEKLNDFRNQGRTLPKQRSRGELQMNVGREVMAVHPVCGHVHSGSILAIYRQNQYMIKFIKPQLGTQKVLDINMMPKEMSNPHRIVVENIDFEVMAVAIKLLEYKNDLIKQLRVYNNRAESVQRERGVLDNKFYQEYGWIGSTINILTLGLRHIISKFRIRGVTAANQEKVGRHFATILLSPLNMIDKELQKSGENSDVNASNQIKKIISSYKESKTEHYSRELFSKYWQTLKDVEWPSEKKGEMEKLLRSLVGLLVNLKVQNRNFLIQDNRYVSDLIGQIDGTFPEHVNEIYETLNSITSKLNEEVK